MKGTAFAVPFFMRIWLRPLLVGDVAVDGGRAFFMGTVVDAQLAFVVQLEAGLLDKAVDLGRHQNFHGTGLFKLCVDLVLGHVELGPEFAELVVELLDEELASLLLCFEPLETLGGACQVGLGWLEQVRRRCRRGGRTCGR